MGGTNTDYPIDPERIRAKLTLEVTTLDRALTELREQLRENRLTLPTYRRVQDPPRYAMTLEDIEDQEREYKQYTSSSDHVFELEDVIDTLARARATSLVMNTVLFKKARERPHASDARRREINWIALAILVAVAAYVLFTR